MVGQSVSDREGEIWERIEIDMVGQSVSDREGEIWEKEIDNRHGRAEW